MSTLRFGILLLFFVVFGFVYVKWDMNNSMSNYYEKYGDYIEISTNDSINGKILRIIQVDPKISRNDANHSFVVIEGIGKRSIQVGLERNFRYKLDDVLKVRSLVQKRKDSDIIYLTSLAESDSIVYEFELKR